MSFGISKTIPKEVGQQVLEILYRGTAGEYEFHMAGEPSRLKVGDYVYTILNSQLVGRCKIIRITGGAINPGSGKPRTLIVVSTPGESLTQPIPLKGHRGTRYLDGSIWPQYVIRSPIKPSQFPSS